MQDNAALLATLRQKRRMTSGDLKGSAKDRMQQLIAAGDVVKLGKAFYPTEAAPSEESEKQRIEELLLSKPRLFLRSQLEKRFAELKPLFRTALANLVLTRRVLELMRVGGRSTDGSLYIHGQHVARLLPSGSERLPEHLGDLSTRIRIAYRTVSERYQRRSVFISDLLRESRLDFPTLKKWIEQEIIKDGHGQLDEGDWSEANEEQRHAAVEFMGRKRLYVALTV